MVILLVEDDISVQFFIWKLLKADGMSVLTASSGEAALQASQSHPGSIELLLTDMTMPGMNGLELSKIVAAERPGIKVVLMSGDSAVRAQSKVAGIPFLQKPFQLADLRQILESVLGFTPGLR